MKYLITFFLISFASAHYCQNTDTLALVQGNWEFKVCSVKGDTNFNIKHHQATNLKIEDTKFTIGLSEAYTGGEFIKDNTFLLGEYLYGDYVFDEMRIYKVKKSKLIIELTTSNPKYWECKEGQNIKVYLKYSRKKVK
jgi:hypothetical protein